MKPAGGGTQRFAPLLLASLLLHMAGIAAVIGIVDRETAGRRSAPLLSVDYIESPGSRERLSEPPAAPPVPVVPPEPRRAVVPPKPLPATPPVAISPRKESGGGAPPPPEKASPKQLTPGGGGPSPVGIAPIAPAAPGGTDMVLGPVGSGGGRGGGTGSGTGEGAGAGKGTGHYGSGTGGTHGGGATPSASPGALQRRVAYQALLRRLIEAHKEYPLAARGSLLEGNCVRRFTIGRSGALRKVEALSSCGHQFLDDAATRAVTAVGTFPPLPDEIAGAEATFDIPIRFTLTHE